MTQRDTEIVAALLLRLTDRVGADAMRLWFGHSESLAWTGEQLVVRAGSHFKLNHIRRNFANRLPPRRNWFSVIRLRWRLK